MIYISNYDVCEQLPLGVVKALGGRVRATSSEHCDSCHEDHNEGYIGYDECWLDDDRYCKTDQLPWSLQFCCCSESIKFEAAVKREIERRVQKTIKHPDEPQYVRLRVRKATARV